MRRATLGVLLFAAGACAPSFGQAPRPEVQEPTRRELLGAPSRILNRDLPTLSLEPGERIYAQPDESSAVLARIDVPTEVELAPGQDPEAGSSAWREVRFRGLRGWVAPAGSKPLSADEVWTTMTPADRELRRQRIARLRVLFGEPLPFGGFELFTDLAGERAAELLVRLEQAAGDVVRAYSERYGPQLLVGHAIEGSLVIFERREDYRHYVATELGLDDERVSGISPWGLAILYAGELDAEAVAAVLVHELTHVLNRQAFGDSLPQWLEEGTAQDLSYHPLDRRGRLRLGELPRAQRKIVHRFQADGRTVREHHRHLPSARVAIACAVADWASEGGPYLNGLMDLTASEFVEPEGRDRRYTESALLIRYLLDGAGDRAAGLFRRRLGEVPHTRRFDHRALLGELGISAAQLSSGVAQWARGLVSPSDCRRE